MVSGKRIGLREVRNLGVGQVIWDAAVAGFGARRQRSRAVSYILFYRTHEGRQRWLTIGRHGAPWTPESARAEAQRLLGDVARGADPATVKRSRRQAKTVAELCDLYLADAEAGRLLTRRKAPKKASTLVTDRGRIARHIKPLLGKHKVAAVTREDVEDFMHDVTTGKTAGRTKTGKKRGLAHVRGGKGTASRTVGLLGSIFTYAVRNRMRQDNPVQGVVRPADGARTRRLVEEEYIAFGLALQRAAAAGIWPPAIAAIRFLALTGWRSGEALALRWDQERLNLTIRTATLADTKTGKSIRPLSRAACDVIRNMPRSTELVFPPTRGNGNMTGFGGFWNKIMALGDMPKDITPHTLRHSFASVAGDMGYSEITIAALIGHKGKTITSKYVHSADAVLLAAADAVANKTLALMGESVPEAQVIPLRA